MTGGRRWRGAGSKAVGRVKCKWPGETWSGAQGQESWPDGAGGGWPRLAKRKDRSPPAGSAGRKMAVGRGRLPRRERGNLRMPSGRQPEVPVQISFGKI